MHRIKIETLLSSTYNSSSLTDLDANSTYSSVPVDPTDIFGPQRDSLCIVVPITIIYSLIFITGVLGNIFTCLVIVRNKSMHTATNYYLFSLAMSDLLLLISGMPQEIYSIWSKWPYVFGHTFCVIRGLAAETSTNASVLTITLFTIERYLAICHPFVSHKMSKLSRASKHVMLLWVVSFILALPQALQFGVRRISGVIMCLKTQVIIPHSFEISTFCFFLGPMISISVLYLLIGVKLRETNISKDQNQKEFDTSLKFTHRIRRKHSQSTRRVVKMLVAVVVAFFVCWAPFHAQRLVAVYGTTDNHLAKSAILHSVYYFLTYISGVFYYVSTCINPIFYHIMSNKFRDAFKATMMQWCCGSKERSATKRCSYTAIAFPKNRTSSGTVNSGNSLRNSLRNETSFRNKSRKENYPTIHICENGKTIVTPPIIERKNCSKHTIQLVIEDELKSKIDTTFKKSSSDGVSSFPVEVALPVAVVSEIISETKDYLSDEPEIYIKEIQLRVVQKEKEYG